MIRRYTQESKLHGDAIYIIHAIHLQAEFCSRFGQYERAIECQREIEPLYDPEEAHVFEQHMRDVYKHMDDLVGETMGKLDPNTLFIVLSDHGFTSFRRQIN